MLDLFQEEEEEEEDRRRSKKIGSFSRNRDTARGAKAIRGKCHEIDVGRRPFEAWQGKRH